MPILLDISRDGKGRIDTGQVRTISVFPICTRPDKGQNGDLPAQCPQKIHPEDLNFGKFSESKVYFNEII